MPDWAQQLINNLPRVAVIFSLYPICFKLFAWVEDRLSNDAKLEITKWLRSTGSIADDKVLRFGIEQFNNEIFGDRQFSVKCFKRTLVLSALSFSVFILLLFAEYRNFYTGFELDAAILCSLAFAFIVFPLDFIGVAVTRRFVRMLKSRKGLIKYLLIITADKIVKILLLQVMLYVAIIITVFSGIDTLIGGGLAGAAFIVGTLLALCPTILLCSGWAWLYLIGLHVVRAAVFLFDVDKQPLRSIGIVGAAVVTTFYGLYAFAIG